MRLIDEILFLFIKVTNWLAVVAFLVAFNQNEALIGERGLLPANLFLKQIENKTNDDLKMKFTYVPSLMWLFDYDNHLNVLLNGISLLGLMVSALVIFCGSANICMMILLWILYHSIVNVGQRW